MAARIAEAKSETFGDKLGDLEGEALVDTLADTLAWAEGGKPCYTVSGVEEETPVEKLADTTEFTLNNTLFEVGALVATLEDAIFGNTLGDVKAYKLIDTLANTLEESEVKVPEAKALVDTVAAPLAEKQVEKLWDTISDVQHERLGDTLRNVKQEALVDT